MNKLIHAPRYLVHVEGEPAQSFPDAVSALDYAARSVFLPWHQGEQAFQAIRNGKRFDYSYGFKRVAIEPNQNEHEEERLAEIAPALLATLKLTQARLCEHCPQKNTDDNTGDHTDECLEAQELIARAEGRRDE